MFQGRKITITVRFYSLAFLGLLCIFNQQSFSSGYFLKGYVYTRGVVEDDDGTQYFAEYDPETGELRNHFPATGAYALDQVSLMSGSQYRSYIERFEAFKKQFYDAEKLAKPEGNGQENPPVLIKRQELLSTQFTLLAGQGGGQAITFHFNESDLQDNTRFILLRPPVFTDTDSQGFQYYSVTGGSADTASLKRAIILMQSPINPEETIGDGVLSLLISKDPSDIDSRVVKTSTNNLGMLTGFAAGVEGATQYGRSEMPIRTELTKEEVEDFAQPLTGVRVETDSWQGTEMRVTDESGLYSFIYGPSQQYGCTMLRAHHDTWLVFKLQTLSFNPRLKYGYPYWAMMPHLIPCDPYHLVDEDVYFLNRKGGFVYNKWKEEQVNYDYENNGFKDRRDFLVDMKILAGQAQLSNEQWSLDLTNPDNPVINRGQAMDRAIQYA